MKRINIKESLLQFDKDTSCQYDLTSLYEACKIDEEDKKKLVQYIDAKDIEATNRLLSNKAAEQGLMEEVNDDISDDELQDIMGDSANDYLKENWTDVYKQFNDLVDKLYVGGNEQEVNDAVEALYREHEGEADWDNAWLRWLEPNGDPSEDPDYDKQLAYWKSEMARINGNPSYRKINESSESGEIIKSTIDGSELEIIENNVIPNTKSFKATYISGDSEGNTYTFVEADDKGIDYLETLGFEVDTSYGDRFIDLPTECLKGEDFEGSFYMTKNDFSEYSDLKESLEDDTWNKQEVISWLEDHSTAWEDVTDFFGSNDLEEIELDDILGWISEHDMLYDDFLAFFGEDVKSLFDESLNEDSSNNPYECRKSINPFMCIKTVHNEWLIVTEVNGKDITGFTETDILANEMVPVELTKDEIKTVIDADLLGEERYQKEVVSLINKVKEHLNIEEALPAAAVAIGAAAATGFGTALGDKIGSKLLDEDLDASTIEQKIKDRANDILSKKYDEEFIEDYCEISVEDTEDNIIARVNAEVSYSDLEDLGTELTKVITEFDPSAYFEPECPGRLVAYVRKDQSEDIVDETILNHWTKKFNAVKSRDELGDVYEEFIKFREHINWGTKSAIYDVVDAKLEEFPEEKETDDIDFDSEVTFNESLNEEVEVIYQKGNKKIIKDGYGYAIDDGINANRFYVNDDGEPKFDDGCSSKFWLNKINSLIKAGKLTSGKNESLTEDNEPEKYEFTHNEPEYNYFTVGGVEVPYKSHEEAKANMKNDYSMENFVDEIRKYLQENDIYSEVYVESDGRLSVHIDDGDWKHEHLYTDRMISKFFFNKGLLVDTDVQVTEEDGSDCYSATHYYELSDLIFSMSIKESIKITPDSKMKEIDIEDKSETGDVGHPIKVGLKDPTNNVSDRQKKWLARGGHYGMPESLQENASTKTFSQWFDEVANSEDPDYYPFTNYIKQFPNAEVLKDVTAEDIRNNAHIFYDKYPVDSIDREKAFNFASEELNIDYDVLYDAWLHEEPINESIDKQLQEDASVDREYERLKKYLMSEYGWTEEQLNKIDCTEIPYYSDDMMDYLADEGDLDMYLDGEMSTWEFRRATEAAADYLDCMADYDDYGDDEVPDNFKDGTWVYDGDEIPYVYQDEVKKVIIKNGEKTICKRAFTGCDSIKTITIPDSVTTIGAFAFYNCGSLQSVIIPNSVTSIGYGAFKGLTKVTIKCNKNSYAYEYAKENDVPVAILNESLNEDTTTRTVGIYGDEVRGMESVDDIVNYLKGRGLTVSDVEGDMEYGWEMNVTGTPSRLFSAIVHTFNGYNSETVEDFISQYAIDDLDEGFLSDVANVGKAVAKEVKNSKAFQKHIQPKVDKVKNSDAYKNISNAVKDTDSYKNVKQGIDTAKDVVKSNIADKNRKATDISFNVNGKDYIASELKYKLNGKEISADEVAKMNAFQRRNVKIMVPRGVKPIKEGVASATQMNWDDDDDFTYDAEVWEDATGVVSNKDFFAEGSDYTWMERVSSVETLDFDNWAVWSALNQETGETEYFVVEEDTEFIDWGPVDTEKEAKEFLQSKVDEWNLDESVNDSSTEYKVTTRHMKADIDTFNTFELDDKFYDFESAKDFTRKFEVASHIIRGIIEYKNGEPTGNRWEEHKGSFEPVITEGLHESNNEINNWYSKEFPDDEVGIEQLSGISFEDVEKDNSVIDHCDTQVRERVLSKINSVSLNEDGSKVLTYEELIELALENYNIGGDGVYECWDEKDFNDYVEEFGPITYSKALKIFRLNKERY